MHRSEPTAEMSGETAGPTQSEADDGGRVRVRVHVRPQPRPPALRVVQ
ncbi:hypothetical protein [Halogranum gelatinilyticum]|nr:hypothetical protein [Halogranum gelatinilyticum]